MIISRNNKGFTLIEIVVALAIASISMIALAKSMAQSSELVSAYETRLLASWVASNEMARLRYESRTKFPSKGTRSETVKMGGREWRYQINITPQKGKYKQAMLVEINVFNNDEKSSSPYAKLQSALGRSEQESTFTPGSTPTPTPTPPAPTPPTTTPTPVPTLTPPPNGN